MTLHPALRQIAIAGLMLATAASFSGCTILGDRVFAGPQAAPAATPARSSALPAPAGTQVAALDTTTAAERAQAVKAAGGQRLGLTIASLGDPTKPGLWIRTPLVAAEAQGRIENPATGASVGVDLLPLAAEKGAGSQVSLAAMRTLGVALTALPEIAVYRD